MLSKLVAVKVVAALSVAGVATGAAAGELPDPLQDLASDAAAVLDVEIPEAGEGDEPELSEEEREAEKAGREAEKAAREAERATEGEGDTADAGKADEHEGGPKPDNHGAVVSECARTTTLQGRAKAHAIAALARGDVDTCDLGGGPAAADVRGSAEAAREAEKAAREAAKDQRKAERAAGRANRSL